MDKDLEEKKLLYKIYADLNKNEHYFDDRQFRYRTIASSWLIATLIAVGYILSRYEEGLPLSPLITAAVVCVFGVIGITVIWALDILLYHTLLSAIAVEEVSMEQKYPWLPQSRSRMSNWLKSTPVTSITFFFYSVSLFALYAVISLLLSLWLIRYSSFWIYINLAIMVICFFLTILGIRKQSKKIEALFRIVDRNDIGNKPTNKSS
ncbi:hypothetical protein JYU14_01725 [Simkania negevensis]|uniref:Uncharacterized protein n=1 Tax=Simkania negevensis TaxID=83561 RepID=A0ABS3AQL1_9BACT|nr:hypothetical protein [Simkania negevensis]